MSGTTPESLDVIIVNYNAGDLLRQCVDSVLASNGVRVRCVVVDNASVDDSLAFADDVSYNPESLVIVRNPDNRGFAVAVNQGVAQGHGSWFMLLNPDAQVAPDDIALLLLHVRPDAGLLGPLIVNPDGTEQRGCRRDFPRPLDVFLQGFKLHRLASRFDFNHQGRPLPERRVAMPAVSGACMLVRREAHEQIGGFDEGYFLHFEDLDYCARMHEGGWGVYFVPSVRVTHAQGGCSRQDPVRISDHKAEGMRRYFIRYPAGQPLLQRLVLAALWVRKKIRNAGR